MLLNIKDFLHLFWGGVFSPMPPLNLVEKPQASDCLRISTGLEAKEARQREGIPQDVETSIAGDFRSEIHSGIE
jgi:hypothetical protein